MTDQHEKENTIKARKASVDITSLTDSLNDSSSLAHDVVMRHESIDILSSSLDNIVKSDHDHGPISPTSSKLQVNVFRKESDASALLALSMSRKESDASALFSLSSLRKESDASALSTLIKEEEMMMQHDEEAITLHTAGNMSVGGDQTQPSRKNSANSDPFENLRKLSDASDAISALRKLSEGSDPLKTFTTKDSDATLGDFKSPENTGSSSILGDMKLKYDVSKDDGSVHLFENNPDVPKVEPTPMVEPTPIFKNTKRKLSTSSLEHLEAALGGGKESDDGSASVATMNDANHKILMDVLLGPTRRNRAESWGGMSDISAHQALLIGNLASAADISTADTPRAGSPAGFEGAIMSPRSQSQDSLTGHLHQATQAENKAKRKRSSSGNSGDSDGLGFPKGRERLDSLSGLIIPMPKGGKDTKGRERLDSLSSMVMGRDRAGSFSRDRAGSFSRDRLDSWAPRDRLDSIATRDRLDSLANLSGIFSKGRDRLDSLASLGEVSLTMSLGDLEDVAGKLESIVHGDDSDICDSASEATAQKNSKQSKQTKGGLSAPTIQVDSEAVQSAVQAAMAATSGGILDMLQINTPGKAGSKNKAGNADQYAATPIISNAKIKQRGHVPIPSTPMDEAKMEEIRARARAAAGYVHPGTGSARSNAPSKKRPLSNPAQSASKRPKLPTQFSTPIAHPKLAGSGRVPSGVHMYSDFSSTAPKRKTYNKGTPSSGTKGGQSNQKWEEMFECLVAYVREQKIKDTQGMSEEDAKKWEWSGNVPTMYKTRDGKALGRWINNQRSAKSKGSLKPEREQRLVSTGLKWSVLTTNAWTDMMEELKLYVAEKTKDGKKWDGNVPTNYKIKNDAKPDGSEMDEDKNLGRWINRQRSLYQSGKLKDDRKNQLEAIGLKWAVLSTTSWHTMYEALCKYAKAKRDADKNNYWDGNVPASYETDDKPPKKLGRWVNRQRSTYANKKLKKEWVEKLEKAGLKWTAMDSKKELENSEVLMRQRVMVQSQRPIIRTVNQTVRSAHPANRTIIHGARPTVSGVRPPVPGTRPVITGNRPGTVVSGARPTVQGTKLQQKQIVRPSVVTRVVPSTVKSSAGQAKYVISTQKSTHPANLSRSIPTGAVKVNGTVRTAAPASQKASLPVRTVAPPSNGKQRIIVPTGSKIVTSNAAIKVPASGRTMRPITSISSAPKVVVPGKASKPLPRPLPTTAQKVTLPVRSHAISSTGQPVSSKNCISVNAQILRKTMPPKTMKPIIIPKASIPVQKSSASASSIPVQIKLPQQARPPLKFQTPVGVVKKEVTSVLQRKVQVLTKVNATPNGQISATGKAPATLLPKVSSSVPSISSASTTPQVTTTKNSVPAATAAAASSTSNKV